jgi:hypothetical protein
MVWVGVGVARTGTTYHIMRIHRLAGNSEGQRLILPSEYTSYDTTLRTQISSHMYG